MKQKYHKRLSEGRDKRALAQSGRGSGEDPVHAEPNWQELADIIVSFGYGAEEAGSRQVETKAYYSQADRASRWPGIAINELMEWITEQAKDFLSGDQHRTVAQVSPAEEPIRLDITNLSLSELRPAEAGLLQAAGRLRISQPSLQQPDEGTRFRAEFYLVKAETQEPLLAGVETGQISPLEMDIQCQFPVPAPGRYLLKAVVRTEGGGEMTTELTGPTLRVEN